MKVERETAATNDSFITEHRGATDESDRRILSTDERRKRSSS